MSAFSDVTLPSTDEEVWRYSRIAELELDAYHPAAAGDAAPTAIPTALDGALATVPVRAATVVVVNGRIAHLDVNAPGVEVVTETDALGLAMSEPTDVFATLNAEH